MRLAKSISWRYRVLKNMSTTQELYGFTTPDFISAFLNRHSRTEKPAIIKLDQQDDFVLYDIGGCKIWWPTMFDASGLNNIWEEIFLPGHKHSYEFPEGLIQKNDWVIDAGSSEGFFVYYALNRNGNVLAVEPVKKLSEALTMTFNTEIKQNRVKILNGLLGNESKESSISLNLDWIFGSSAKTDGEKEACRQYTIDEILATNIIPTVNFIKMDIEGNEPEALQGAAKTLKTLKPKLAICTYHDPRHAIELKDIILSYQPEYKIKYGGAHYVKGVGIIPTIIYCY